MYDPGLPPKPKSLNLLESLVKEEEDRVRESQRRDIYVPSQDPHLNSLKYSDSGTQSETIKHSAGSYSEYKMKETKSTSKVVKGNPNAGFKGKKVKKQRSRSDSSERLGTKNKKSHRPFSADYNQNKREMISSSNGRVKSAKGQRGGKMSTTKGQRPRSPESYSSDSYSSDEEYIKKEYHRKKSKNSDVEKKTYDSDSFFDSDKDHSQKKAKYSSDDSKKYSSSDSYSSSEDDRKNSYKQKTSKENNDSSDDSKSSSSDSYSSSEEEDRKKTVKRMESHESKSSDGQRNSKTVYVDKFGRQHSRPRSGSNGSDYKRMVVVDDYSSLSSDEETEPKTRPGIQKPPRLLARKKKAKLKVFQIDPDMYLEGKLQQKYCELEELMACSFVDQKKQITRHHLYQMELLRDQYKMASHGRPSSALIIPRSLPEGIRNKGQRPSSAKKPLQRYRESDTESYENAYETIRSVMAAERARKTSKIRTDIHAERPISAKRTAKKKKKIEAKFKSKLSDSEEDISEKPSTASKGSNCSRSDGSSLTPRGVPAIDHHIKYSENVKLKKWLKEKDKLYRKNVKEEKKKKREEREKLINEANDKLERKIESKKRVKEWSKEKNKEYYVKRKQEKKKHDLENNAKQKKEVVLPGEFMQIKRTDDVKVENDKCKGQETPEYVKDQIHKKREIREENKQASVAAKGGPHPPQTKFIYKRPVAGKIKLNMQVRGKSPVAQRPDSGRKEDEEKEKNEKMRLSYDEWVKKKMEEDSTKKKVASKMKENELAKSDPELNRLIPDIAKRRIEDKLNSRKKVNTGIKHFDDKTNKSFGGSEFNGDVEKERPRSAYRLEGDTSSSESTTKQVKRPSTAPTSRTRMPLPKKSASSPRKAIIPQRVDKVMENKDEANPYVLPFPPEKGIPAHVAARQRKLFADKVADKLSEQDQKELLQEVLVKEGVADIDETSQNDLQNQTEPETKQADITSLMYSPRKKHDSSESSESDNEITKETEVTEEKNDSKEAEADSHIDSFGTKEGNTTAAENVLECDTQADVQSNNQYKTYENLNELHLDSSNTNNSNSVGADLGVDIESLRERVELLTADSTGPPLLCYGDPRDSYESRSTDDDDHESQAIDSKNIKVISEDTDPNLVSILKERKQMDDIPVPERSDEPTESTNKASDIRNDASSQLTAEDSLNASRKRVSFNEQTEVFQSLESSSSTDTLTPEQSEFDPNAESLDNQPYDDFYEPGDNGNDDGLGDEINGEQTETDSDYLSFNIGGFEINPAVIDPATEEVNKNEEEGKSTFITDPN